MVIIYPTTMQHPRYYQTIMNGMANKYSAPQYHLFVIKYVRDREKEREMGGIIRYALKSGVRSLGLDLSFGF